MILLRERFLVLETLLCDAGGTSRAPSAEPRAQGPRAREAQARALRCGGWGTGEQGRILDLVQDREGKLSTGGLRAWWEGGPPGLFSRATPVLRSRISMAHCVFKSGWTLFPIRISPFRIWIFLDFHSLCQVRIRRPENRNRSVTCREAFFLPGSHNLK